MIINVNIKSANSRRTVSEACAHVQ